MTAAAADRRRPAGIDRISQLPDHILHLILSPLPMIEVVRTCVLSKRWRNLWASAPHLRFSYDDEGFKKINMQDFIDMALLLRHSNHIHTFHLSEFEPDYTLPDRWIRYAAIRQVQNLHLSCEGVDVDEPLPLPLFSCQSLITLSLQGYTCIGIVPSVHLGRLVELKLNHMSFEGDSLGKLISGCPVLQHLSVEGCEIETLDISSLRLRTLNFVENYSVDDLDRATTIISAPSLISLVHASGNIYFSLKNASSLVSASISASPETKASLTILDSLYHVQYLNLNCPALEYIFCQIVSLEQLPVFPNLKKLEVFANLGDGPIQAITCLLQCAPNLEQLEIIEDIGHSHNFSKKNWEPRECPASFLTKLKSVKVQSFQGGPVAHEFLSFLLSNANVLEKILLSPRHAVYWH